MATRAGHYHTIDREMPGLRNCERLTFSYDGEGRLASMTDGDGLVTSIQYVNPTQVTVTGPYGHQTSIELDSFGNLRELENEAADRWSVGYNARGLLTSFEDPVGRESWMSYDADGRLTSDTNAAGGTKTLTKTETLSQREVQLSTGEGRDTTYTLERENDGTTRRIVERDGNAAAITESAPDGSQAATTPGGALVSKLLQPDPRFGMQSPLVKSAGVATPGGKGIGTATSLDRAVKLDDPSDPESLTEITDRANRGGAILKRTVDVDDQTETTTSPAGRIVTQEFDELRRPIRVIAPGRSDVVIARDAHGRVVTSTQGTRTTSYTYDARGRVATVTDPGSRITAYEYDAADRVIGVDLPDGQSVAYAYNRAGEVTSITPAGKPAHLLGRNPLGLLSTHTPPPVSGAGAATQFDYDDDGLLSSATRADGRAVTTTRDGQGRATRIAFQGGGLDLTYGPDGHLAAGETDAGQDFAVTRDGGVASRVTWSGSVVGTVDVSYDALVRVQSMRVNNTSQINYSYDADDLLTSAGTLSLSRSASTGEVTSASIGTTTTAYDRDAVYGELEELKTTTAGGAVAFKQVMARDSVGRVSALQETVDGQTSEYTYTYDQRGRLTGVERGGQPWASYTYDHNGNRLSASAPGQTASATYDDQDRLLTHGAASYVSTLQGERASRAVGSDVVDYDYNDLGQLVSVGLADGRTVEYVWDAEGRRVGRKVDGVFTQRLVFEDAMRPAAEVNAAGGVVTRFVYGERLAPEYFVRGGVTYRVLVDHLGSVRLVVNANTGAVVQRLAYDPCGRVIENTNPGFQPFGFAGGLYDGDAHLVHFGAREYDPETGRWLTRDPLLFDGGDTNLYGYVLGDPVNLTDPAGLFALPWLQSVSDFAAGFGDTISFGITREIREVLGSNSAVNFCSAAYRAGGNSGEAYAMVLPGPKLPRGRLSVNWTAQEKHFLGHERYIEGRSQLTGDPRKLVDRVGTGQPVGTGSRERIDFGEPIGTYVDPATGVESPTTRGILHRGRKGAHVVPARPG